MAVVKTSVVTRRAFKLLADPELPRSFSGFSVKDCSFMACSFGQTAHSPADRRTIRGGLVSHCKATNNCALGPVVLEDVEIDCLETAGLFIAWGAAYRHVRIRGRCGKFLLAALPPFTDSATVRKFVQADLEFYKSTDWALDISEGEFQEFDIRSVPADLVRRDPETQVVVRRRKVESLQADWRSLDLSGTPWVASLTSLLESGYPDKVLVAPKRRKDFGRWKEGLNLLRSVGVAE